MKRTILILAVLASGTAITVQAQSKAVPMTSTGDTLNAASAVDTSISYARSVGYYANCSFTAGVAKVSGTVTGYGLLQYSNDGVYWFDQNTDTLQITNQAVNKKAWPVNVHAWRNYRVWIRLATGVAVPSVTGYFNKPKNY